MIEYRGEKFSGYNKPKRTPGHSTKSHAVLAKKGKVIRMLRFGQQGVSGAGSWNSTPQRVRVYANELMEAGFMNESSARSAWKNTDKLEALIRTVNPRLP